MGLKLCEIHLLSMTLCSRVLCSWPATERDSTAGDRAGERPEPKERDSTTGDIRPPPAAPDRNGAGI